MARADSVGMGPVGFLRGKIGFGWVVLWKKFLVWAGDCGIIVMLSEACPGDAVAGGPL